MIFLFIIFFDIIIMEENKLTRDNICSKHFDYLIYMNYERYCRRIDLHNINLRRFENDVKQSIIFIEKDMIIKNHLLIFNDIEYFFTKTHIISDLMTKILNTHINQQCTTLFWDKLIQKEEYNYLIYKQIQDIIKEMQIKLQSIS